MPEYILTLKNKGYSLSACLSTKGVLNAKPQFENTLNIFVETFFSPDIFGLTFSFFLSRLITNTCFESTVLRV